MYLPLSKQELCAVCSVFTMSELLTALHKAGKIEEDMVLTVNKFIEQNQLHTAAAVVNNPNTVSITSVSYEMPS